MIICIFAGIHPLFVKAYAPQYTSEKTSLKLRWKTLVIPITLSNSLLKQTPNIRPESDVRGAIKRSLETWESVANIKFEIDWSEKQSASVNGTTGDGVSLITNAQTTENLLMFSKDSEDVSARTRVFFNKKGIISEADIVLNPYQQFSTDGSIGTFDLESTLTHEFGHLLGLEHSTVFGATMHENSSKNGVFNLPSWDSRTLAQTDISAIRAVYGDSDKTDCCASITGKLTLQNNKPAKKMQVWIEESSTGKVFAQTVSNSEGNYQLDGILKGKYQIYAQESDILKSSISGEKIGEFEIDANEKLQLNKKISPNTKPFDLRYIGFNGQISELAVPLNGGKSYIVYLGAEKMETENIQIGFNTPFLKVLPDTINEHDFGENLSVISFEVRVENDIPKGEYSIFVESNKKVKEFIIGGLVIDEVINPWSIFIFSES